jgi:hypothetical protein
MMKKKNIQTFISVICMERHRGRRFFENPFFFQRTFFFLKSQRDASAAVHDFFSQK